MAAEPSRADRRQALVHAAYLRLARDGFEGLRTRDVAADAGVNIATLHYYYPTKEALIRAVIGEVIGRFTATLPAEGSAGQRLRAHLDGLQRLIKEDHQLWAVMGELVLRTPRDPDLAQIFRATDQFWHRTLLQLLADSIEEHAIAADVDPEPTATLLMSVIRGLSLPTMSDLQPGVVDQVFREITHILGLRI
jgi:AcrR family transcriptional regulator